MSLKGAAKTKVSMYPFSGTQIFNTHRICNTYLVQVKKERIHKVPKGLKHACQDMDWDAVWLDGVNEVCDEQWPLANAVAWQANACTGNAANSVQHSLIHIVTLQELRVRAS